MPNAVSIQWPFTAPGGGGGNGGEALFTGAGEPTVALDGEVCGAGWTDDATVRSETLGP